MILIGTSLELFKVSKGTKQFQLLIPLPDDNQWTGPAGWACAKSQLVYVPDKGWEEGWPFTVTPDGRYQAGNAPHPGWVPAGDPEALNSCLSIPVNLQKRKFGVLNFSTKSRDPFVDRDFLMAECFVGLLSQAISLKQRITALEKLKP